MKFAFIATVVAMAAKKTQQKVQWLSDPTVAPLVLDAPFSALDPEYQGSVAKNLAAQATQLVLMISSAHWSKSVSEALAPQVGKRYCWRRSNIDHLCRLNFDQGTFASRTIAGCG